MTSTTVLVRVLVYLLAAVVAVPIAKRAGLGSVLGFLVAGALIGPHAFNLVGDPTQVGEVAEFGVVILLFLVGLELRPLHLWQMRTGIFGLGFAQMASAIAVIMLLSQLIGIPWRTALVVGATLAMSSTALVLSTLEEKGLRARPVGSASFGVLLFQDLSVIPLFLLLPLLALAPSGSGASVSANAGFFSGLLAGVSILGAVAFVVIAGRFAVRPLFRFIAATRSREVFTAAALMIVVGVAALMTAVGLSPALGTFVAGVVLAETEFRRELESDIEPFRGLLLGLFFMTVGAGLDLSLIASAPAVILGLAIAFMGAKALTMAAVAKLFRFKGRDAGFIGIALCQGGEFAFVLISFARNGSLLGPFLSTVVEAVVAVSMLLAPLTFLAYDRVIRWLDRPTGAGRDPDFEFEDGADVIIAGFGRFGQIAGRLLQANGHRLSIMDSSLGQIELLRRFGRRVNFGDASRLDLLRSAGAQKAKLLIVAIDDREKALEIVETAKAAFPHLIILARAFDRRHAYELLEKGADDVESETYESSLQIGRQALNRLGHRAHRAHRAAALFRMHDQALFRRFRPEKTDDSGILHVTRATRDALERLLAADLEQHLNPVIGESEWSTRELYAALTEENDVPVKRSAA